MSNPQRILRAAVLLLASAPALAQDKLGSYVGTATISGTLLGREHVTYKADLKLALPITQRDSRLVTAEQFGDPPLATATAQITRWNVTGKEASASSDGKIDNWTCTLTAPTEVPLSVHGVLRVDLSQRTQEAFMGLVSFPEKTLPLTCNHSRTGPYKEDKSVSFFFGTSEGTLAPYKTQPAPDPTRLTAKFTYEPVAELKGQEGPIALEWDLKLVR